MKRVVNSSMVAHLWANQVQSDARNATGSMFFEGDTIYSYGRHFPIARHTKALDGRAIALFTTRRHSVTTAKHIGEVRRALRGRSEGVLECTHVNCALTTGRANLQGMREECLEKLEKASRARSYTAMYLRQAEALVVNHLAYRTAFGLELDEPLTISEEWKKDAKGRVEAQKALEVERKRQADIQGQQRRVTLLADLEQWKTGDIVYRSGFSEVPTALRARYAEHVTGQTLPDTIQTSRGAEVPATHARRIWGLINKIRATGVPYQRNGHSEHVGQFTVDSITTDGTLVAGCHTITFEAMAELAGKLGW